MNQVKLRQWENLKRIKNTQSDLVVYELMFAALIPPFGQPNMKINLSKHQETKARKVLIKKSYLMLTWFYYMQVTQAKKPTNSTQFKVSIAILPSKRKLYTLTKAPMAHKTNSKEQFQFKFYFYKISVKTYFSERNSTLLSDRHSNALFGVRVKRSFPFFETNVMFLKYAKVRFPASDLTFFNLYAFITAASNRKIR